MVESTHLKLSSYIAPSRGCLLFQSGEEPYDIDLLVAVPGEPRGGVTPSSCLLASVRHRNTRAGELGCSAWSRLGLPHLASLDASCNSGERMSGRELPGVFCPDITAVVFAVLPFQQGANLPLNSGFVLVRYGTVRDLNALESNK